MLINKHHKHSIRGVDSTKLSKAERVHALKGLALPQRGTQATSRAPVRAISLERPSISHPLLSQFPKTSSFSTPYTQQTAITNRLGFLVVCLISWQYTSSRSSSGAVNACFSSFSACPPSCRSVNTTSVNKCTVGVPKFKTH